MKTSVRAGIVTVAATVALGTAGFAVASADSQEPVVKREDTASSWTQSTNVDDDDDLRDDSVGDTAGDSPTNTANTVNTAPTKNTALTKNTAPTKNTVKTVNSVPTKNSTPTNDPS
jgi:hypothetical protein